MINFKGKKILITGATGGIGKALVKKFLSLDGTILATGTNTEKLDSLKKEFPNLNVLKFENAWSKYFRVKHSICVNSCTAALHL